MKRVMLAAFLVVVAVTGLSAAGSKEDPITGTWYGGSSNTDNAGFKYIYQFSPIAEGRWQLVCFPASIPEAYGPNKLMTPFCGEIVRTATGYELRLLSLATATAEAPPRDLPVEIAGRAILTVVGPNEIRLLYDTAGVYAWGKVPYVDDALAWAYRPGNGGPVPETLHRLQVGVPINLK